MPEKEATTDSILLKLGEIVGQNNAILQRLDNSDSRLNVHSQRIGSLERWRSYIIGAVAVIMFMLSWLTPIGHELLTKI